MTAIRCTEECRQEPFETAELVAQRWDQRRLLRSLDRMDIEAAAKVSPPTKPDDPSTWVPIEALIRNEIDRLAKTMGPVLDEFHAVRTRNDLSAFLEANALRVDVLFAEVFKGARPANPVAEFAKTSRDTPKWAAARSADRVGFAVLLLWADDLAGDGYKDCRLREMK